MAYHPIIRKAVSHVVPTEHNGFIPHILKDTAIWSMLGVGIALFAFSQVLRLTNYLNTAAEVYPTTIITLTNQDRAAQGIAPLSVNETLVRAAEFKARDMAANSYFAHTSPAGITPWHWFSQAGYKFIYAGENLAINYNESTDVETAWLNSPTHRANLLSSNFTEIGVATANGVYNGAPTTYVVQLFGMPAVSKASPAKEISKPSPKPKDTPVATVPEPKSAAVAGESVTTLQVIADEPTFAVVKDTDPTLAEQPIIAPVPPKAIPWYDRIIINADKYIAGIIEGVIILLILATTALAAHEYEKHHRKHMAYGILMTVILTSFLFVGRIGVFARSADNLPPNISQPTQ